MKKQNGFIKILFAVIFLIFITGVYFIYIYSDYNAMVLPLPQLPLVNHDNSSSVADSYLMKELTREEYVSVEADVAGWKIYKNDKYGFEFKYPKEWLIDERSKTDKSISVILSKDGINRFDLTVYDPIADVYGERVTLDEYLSQYSYESNNLREDKRIGGVNMLYFESKSNKDYKDKSFRYIVPVRKDLMYEFTLNSTDNNDIISFDKIIFTFKFTK